MEENKLNIILGRVRQALSNVNLKTYLYALVAIGVIAFILINVSSPKKYGSVRDDGKFYLDIERVARDYGINLNNTEEDANYLSENSDVNLTQDLAQSLHLTNLYLEQNGMTDPTARGKILADIILNYQEQFAGNKYRPENLNIIRQENKEALQEYYEKIYNTFSVYGQELSKLPKNPFAGYVNADSINEDSFNALWKEMQDLMQENINLNNALINNLISIPATERGAKYQLDLINLIAKENAYYKSLQQIDIDPAKYILVNADLFPEDFTKELSTIAQSFYFYFMEFGIEMR